MTEIDLIIPTINHFIVDKYGVKYNCQLRQNEFTTISWSLNITVIKQELLKAQGICGWEVYLSNKIYGQSQVCIH